MFTGNVSAADWGKGIGLSVLASVIGGASKLAIRKSWILQHDREELHESSDDTNTEPLTLDDGPYPSTASERMAGCLPYVMRYSGMFGMSVLNPICCILAMNYASPSILAPFSGLTLVWVILFSGPIVGEKPSSSQIIAACLIILGEVVVAVFGDHTNDDGVTVEDVKKSYQESDFIVFLIGLTLWLLLLMYWILASKSEVLRRFAWGCSGGSLTGLQNFLKDTLTIMKATHAGEHYPKFIWLFMVLGAGTAFGGLLFLTACMKRYDATYSAASFVGSFVITASVMAAVHYHTFETLQDVASCVLYPAGLGVLCIGVFILVREGSDNDEDDILPSSSEPDISRKDSEDELPFVYRQVDDDKAGAGLHPETVI